MADRLNGREIPLKRGGPVRMVVPWAHGFKSIKWLQKVVLTADFVKLPYKLLTKGAEGLTCWLYVYRTILTAPCLT